MAGTTYTAHVRNDNRLGTVATTSITSLARSQPVASVSNSSYPTCWNSSNGSLTLSASGGSGGYTYSIDNGTTYQGSNVFGSLTSNTYYYRVKDNNGCESSSTQIVLTTNTPNVTFTNNNISCYGGSDGSITTAIIDSNGIYYRYNAGGGFTNTSGTRYNVGTSVGSLTADSYTFRIYNSPETCYQDYTITLTQPTQQTASITSIIGATNGLNNGSLTISSGGGTWNKTYRLYKDSATPYNDYPTDNLISTYSNVTSGSPTFNVEGLACGYYWLQVTDANGCVTNTIEYEVPCPQIYYAYQVIRCSNNSTSTMTSPDLLPSQFTSGGTKAVKIDSICYQIDYYITSTYNQGALHLVDGQYATIYNTCNDCTGGGGGGGQQL